MPLVAVVQIGPAFAPQAPQFNQGENAACVVTFFDSVTHVQTDPDNSAITGVVTNPDGSTAAIVCSRTAQGAYSANIAFPQAGTYGVEFDATQAPQALKLETTVTVVASYVSSNALPNTQWTFVSASSPTPPPYQAVPGAPNIAADLRGGAVTIDFWSPTDGDEITVKDWYDLAGTQVLTVVAEAGAVLEDPANPGNFVASARCVPPLGFQRAFAATWKYSLAKGAWGLKP